jgi:phosphohistidine phosphatase
VKVLILVRHAKSSWKHAGLPDPLRPLNKRGKRDAPMMGGRLARRNVEPELMVSSPAVRAVATAKAFAREMGYPVEEIRIDARMYQADVLDLLEVVEELDDALDCVVLFGHNPGLTELANDLSSEVANLPTCGVVELHFQTAIWATIAEKEPVFVDLDYPKRIDR